MPKGFFGCIVLVCFCICLLACVGPTSPFGKLEPTAKTEAHQVIIRSATPEESILTSDFMFAGFSDKPILRLYPKQQVLHDKFQLKIYVYDQQKISEHPNLQVFYNNQNVSQRFLSKAQFTRLNAHILMVNFENVKISPTRQTEISFIYRSSDGSQSQIASYDPPICEWAYRKSKLQSTGSFEVSPELKDKIEFIAEQEQLNPNLIAGLIAQESGFNRKAVSISKGIGLTQITPVAEQEVLAIYPYFPRYPSLNDLHHLSIRTMINLDLITEAEEWRLNPLYSIRGGIGYLKYLRDYWKSFARSRSLASVGMAGEMDRDEVSLVLASYNAGFVRVGSEIRQHQKMWLNSDNLIEAKKYVNLVSSYCSLFSQRPE